MRVLKPYLFINEEGTAVRMVGALQDITELKQQRKEIQNSLKEKETLLSEVHHRVKNNLAVVSGMMQLQAFNEDSGKLKSKLLDCVTRIQSIATIHEHLYQTNNFSNLEFSKNLKILVNSIVETLLVQTKISVDFDLTPVQLNVNQAYLLH